MKTRSFTRGRPIEMLEQRTLFAPQTVSTSFLAAKVSESGFIPPDSMGEVGPSQILICENGRIKVFDKNGVLGGLNETTDVFFASVRSAGTSDPHVRYDRLSGRWFITMIDTANVNRVLIAVSTGSTITGHSSFNFFQFRQDLATPTGNTNSFADYDTLGVDKFALYIGVNEFLGNSLTTTAFVVNKANLIAGTLTVKAFRNIGSTSSMFTPQGVDNDDPNATEGYFIGTKDSGTSGTILTIQRVSDPGGTPTLGSTMNVTVPVYTHPIPQGAQGSSIPLDGLDTRLYAAEITRNKLTGALSLWTAHTIQVGTTGTPLTSGGRNAARWYEIGNLTSTPTLLQSGTLFDSALTTPRGYWVPSVAANGQGSMALSSSVAGANLFASIATAGRLASDPTGTLESVVIAQSSSTSYNVQTGVSSQRWGDYSQTGIDPNDDMTMWTFQEYCDSATSWGVRAIKLLAPPPATPSGTDVSSIPVGSNNVTVVLTGTSASGSAFFDPGPDTGGPGFANHISATVDGGGVTVNSVVFTDPTHITLNLSVAPSAAGGLRTITVTNPDGQSAISASGLINIIAGTGSIAGQVFVDVNGNGLFGASEPTMNGVTIFLDTDNSGTLNGTEPSVMTSGSGNFSFTGLGNGPYNVREILPIGFIGTTPTLLTPTVSGGGAVSGQNFALFPIVFNGGSGNDTFTISLDAGGTIEQINDGATLYTIAKAQLPSLTFNGVGGDDTLIVDASHGSVVPAFGITFDGGANGSGAGDLLSLIGGATSESATFNAGTVTFGGTITDSAVERFSFNGGGGNDNLTVNSGAVSVPASQVLQTLVIASGALVTLAPGGGKVISTKSLSITGGTLDLTDTAMILDYTGGSQLSTVLGLIGTARTPTPSGPVTWTGPGITSSTAATNLNGFSLGAIDNSSLGVAAYSTFFAQPVDLTSVLVRYTVNGDANLDGKTNTSDFNSLAMNFNQGAQVWGGGDFNFDNVVNALDFNALATNFGQTLAAPAPAPLGSLFSDDGLSDETIDPLA